MSDAYSEWLDIPANLRPPTYYQLLGIAPSELDPAAIAAAAGRRLELLRAHDGGPRSDEARRIATEVAQARDTLLDPVRRLRYDTMTPDAADPWWKPESDAPAAVETAPVAGWWQGATPDAHPAPPPSPAPPAKSAEPPPVPAPVPAEANDWWKAGPADAAVAEPPTRPTAPPPPPAAPAPPPLPPRPAPTGPLIREEALAFAPSGGSPMRWVFVGIVFVAATGAGLVALTKPWARTEPPDEKPVVEIKPKIDPPTVATTTTVPPRATTSATVPKVAVTKPPPPPPHDPPPPKPPTVTPGSDEVTEPITFRGHKGGVFGVAVGRSGKTILSVSDDQNVLLYSPGERGKHGQLHRLGSPGVGVALCNDDRDAVVCDGGEVIVLDVGTRKPRATFENPRGGIRSLAAAPNASFVLSGATDGTVRWWNRQTKSLEHTLDVDPKATITAVAIAADMKAAALGLSDGKVCTWDLRGRKEMKRWKAHTGSVTAVGYSPDGQRIVSAGEDGLGQIWTVSGSSVQKLAGHEGPVTGAAWLPDGRRVLTAGIDKQVRLWDQDKGWKVAWSADAGDRAFCLTLDGRGRFAAVGLADGAVRLLPLPKLGAAPGE